MYEDLLFIAVCSDFRTLQHCAKQTALSISSTSVNICYSMCNDSITLHCRHSSAQGKMQSPLFSAALPNRLTGGTASLQLHLWSFALHTGVQSANRHAVQLCSGQNAIPTVQCCSAKQAHSRQCVTAITPMEICSSYRCAMTNHQCTAALFRA
jgi:hypothetical protein